MANTVTSGWFTSTVEDALTNITALDLELDTHKSAIYTTAGTIAVTVYDQVAPTFASIAATYGGVEVANSTGWVAPGGELLNATEVTLSPANSVMFNATDYGEADTTFTNGEFLVIYADALATPVAKQLSLIHI